MSRAQRFTFLGIAVVIAVVAVILITSGNEDTNNQDVNSAASTATATPTQGSQKASPQETRTPTATPTPLLESGKVAKLEFTEGDTVKLRMVSDVDEEVHVHGYDIARDLPAGKTVTVSFPATITGIFEIEFEHAGEPIAELRVDPK